MSVNFTFDCNLCEITDIKDGVTVVYEHDQSGNIGSNISFYRCYKGLHYIDPKVYPKSIHICSDCHKKISKPVDFKK